MDKRKLTRQYYTPGAEGSYSSVEALHRAVPSQSKKNIKKWLKAQTTATIHKPIRHKFKTNSIYVKGLNDLVQMDLADVSNLAKYNNGVNFLLILINCFSRYVHAYPVKTKSAEEILAVFQKYFKTLGPTSHPKAINSDRGVEFYNKKVLKFFRSNKVNFFSTPQKAQIAERVIRTIKSRIHKFLTANNTKRYIDNLDSIIAGYNNSYHRSIKTKPKLVTKRNEKEIFNRLYPKAAENQKPLRYNLYPGTYVRVALPKNPFAKGYTPGFSKEIYQIARLIPREIPVYELKDKGGYDIQGIWYESDLNPVTSDEFPDPLLDDD